MRLLALLLTGLLVATACYDGGTPDVEGPSPAGPGREVLRKEYALAGARSNIRDTAEVADPISGGAKVSLRVRNLGDPASGEFHAASLNIGAGALGEIVFPTNGGVRTLFPHADGTLRDDAPTEAAVEMPIPSVEAGALSFSLETESLILSGTYKIELDVNAPDGPTTLEVTVAAE